MKKIYLLLAFCTLVFTAGCAHLDYCNGFCGYYDSKYDSTDEVLRLHHNHTFTKTERYVETDARKEGWKLKGTWEEVGEDTVELTVNERWLDGEPVETAEGHAKLYYKLDTRKNTFEHASFSN